MSGDWHDWLRQHACGFPVRGADVSVLSTPTEFYQTLTALTSGTRQRLVLSSLYTGGDGALEQELVRSVAGHLRCHPEVQATVVMDGARCSRSFGPLSSSALLGQLQAASTKYG